MSAPATLAEADRRELEALVVEHAWLLDHGRWHDMADLYLPDATLSGGPAPLQGRAALLDWADRRAANRGRRTHHQCSNIRVVPLPDGSAEGSVMLVLYVSTDGGVVQREFVGQYRDLYRRSEDGRWRFAARALVPLTEAP